MGYKYEVLRFTRGTHCLTADFTLNKKNLKDVLERMLSFMRVQNETEVPILFVGLKNLEPAEFITNFILEKAGSSANLRVFPINNLLQEFILCKDTDMVNKLMEKDPYAYHHGLGCGLHEGLDRSVYCSLSISKRMVFTVVQVTAKCRNFQLR